MKDQVFKYLQEFDHLSKIYAGPIPDSITIDFQRHQHHIVFGSVVHGNEIGSLPAMIQAIQMLLENKITYGGKVTFFLGNRAAVEKQVRFIDFDLNRAFGESLISSNAYEFQRANELKIILQKADLFLDFHQTTRPTKQPFYIFPWHLEGYLWAKGIGGAQALVTRPAQKKLSHLGGCTDDFVRSFGKPAITLELGEQGFSNMASALTQQSIQRACSMMDKIAFQTSTLKRLSKKNNPLDIFITIYKMGFTHEKMSLKEGWENFSFVHQGELLGWDENQQKILSPHDGFLLFPKYPERLPNGNAVLPLPGELYTLIAKQSNFYNKYCDKIPE